MLKEIFARIVKGFFFSTALALVGAAYALLKGWPLLKGAYILVLSGGIVTILLSTFLLIGTPSMRRKMIEESGRDEKEAVRGGEGIAPALMGLVMVAIGLLLESLMH